MHSTNSSSLIIFVQALIGSGLRTSSRVTCFEDRPENEAMQKRKKSLDSRKCLASGRQI